MKTLSSKTFCLLSALIIGASVVLSLVVSPQMPEMMASHWGVSGEVNGYMPKFWGLFLMPIVSLSMLALFWAIPKIDPLKKNIDSFRGYYDEFILVLLLFLFYIHGATLVWNLGYIFDMGVAVVAPIGLLFIFIGRILEHSKRNWFVGIRTPWTLSSDDVWEKTHALGARLFRIAGILTLLSLLYPKALFLVMFTAVIAASLIPIVYSYILYKREQKP